MGKQHKSLIAAGGRRLTVICSFRFSASFLSSSISPMATFDRPGRCSKWGQTTGKRKTLKRRDKQTRMTSKSQPKEKEPLAFARSSDPGTNPGPCLPLPTFQSTLTLSKSVCFCKSKWPASTLQSFTNTRERTEKPAEHIRARLRPGSHAPPPYMDACCMNIQA